MSRVIMVSALWGFTGIGFSQDASMGKDFFELYQQFEEAGDYKKSRRYLERAVEAGHAPAQTLLGSHKLNDKDDLNNRLHGLGLITLAANEGDNKARHILANLFLHNDLGLPVNKQEGLRRLRELMKEGSAEARYVLGRVYLFGFGVDKDEERSLVYIKQAAENGHPPAQAEMADASANNIFKCFTNDSCFRFFSICFRR